jgi:hypothetical protein
VTTKLNTEAAAAWRAEGQNELQAAMSDQSWGTLHSLLVVPDAKEGKDDVFFRRPSTTSYTCRSWLSTTTYCSRVKTSL